MTETRLQVPYSQKDDAKALGARWSGEFKTWYVPDGAQLAPFERWLDKHAPAELAPGPKARPPRVDSYVGKTIVGAHYFQLSHDCSPFAECAECRPILESSGWADAKRAALAIAGAALDA